MRPGGASFLKFRLSRNLVLSVSQPHLYGYIHLGEPHIVQPGELRWAVRQPELLAREG